MGMIYIEKLPQCNPTKGHLLQLERSIVRQLAEAVEKGGAQAWIVTGKQSNFSL